MLNVIVDAAKIGLGAILLSRESLKKLSDNMADFTKMSRDEGDKLFRELETMGEEQRKKLAEMIDSSVKAAMDKAGVVSKTEADELKKRITALEEDLAKAKAGQ